MKARRWACDDSGLAQLRRSELALVYRFPDDDAVKRLLRSLFVGLDAE